MPPATIDDVLERYHTLCQWCDRFYGAVHERLGEHMQCGRGCWFCCTMKSVSQLEAHAIREYLEDLEAVPSSTAVNEYSSGACPMLADGECAIYPVRPVICRTHGVPMRHGEDGNIGSCRMNFEKLDLDTVDPSLVLDERKLTENLMRLNVAYCRLCGLDDSPDGRVLFTELLDQARPADT